MKSFVSSITAPLDRYAVYCQIYGTGKTSHLQEYKSGPKGNNKNQSKPMRCIIKSETVFIFVFLRGNHNNQQGDRAVEMTHRS